MLKKIFVSLLFINLLFLDGYLLYVNFFKTTSTTQNSLPRELNILDNQYDETGLSDSCGDECKRYIDEKTASLAGNKNLSPTITPKPTESIRETVSTKTKVKNVSYLPIPGSGQTLSTNWVSLSGTDFYLSKGDYPGLTGIYFEANMRLMNGNGVAFLRIYDATHGIGVVGSEIQTQSQSSTFVSGGPMNLWEGYNHYVVQAKSLTADTTIYEFGRLKIITEN